MLSSTPKKSPLGKRRSWVTEQGRQKGSILLEMARYMITYVQRVLRLIAQGELWWHKPIIPVLQQQRPRTRNWKSSSATY